MPNVLSIQKKLDKTEYFKEKQKSLSQKSKKFYNDMGIILMCLEQANLDMLIVEKSLAGQKSGQKGKNH